MQSIEVFLDLKTMVRVKQQDAGERERLEGAVSRLRVRPPGRPSSLSEEDAERARRLHRHSLEFSIGEIANVLGADFVVGQISRQQGIGKM